jgi:3-oxocholest-4-en-26-oate---CoA ligase
MECNLAALNETVAAAIADREAFVWRDRRLSYGDLTDRTRRLANVLLDHGFRVHRERPELQGWESGQDHLALYLYNGNEYIEGMLGAYKARVAPFNVNYRYVEEELVYLLNDARARGIVYHSAFAPMLTRVRAEVPTLELLLQVDDESGNPLIAGATWYEDALSDASSDPPAVEPSPDDLYILYTGGTTGMPKGVLWRQADIFPAAMGGREVGTGAEWPDVDSLVTSARDGGVRLMPAPPFMHGAAHWMAFTALNWGNTLVLPGEVRSLDPADIWSTVQREGVNILLVVGDAFGRPLLDELERGDYDLSSMLMLVSGGATLSAPIKSRFLEICPTWAILDGLGSSETGQQATQVSAAGGETTTGFFIPGPGMAIASEDLSRLVEPPSTELGWLAQRGRVPLGYLGDQDKTERTFPVIDDVRYSVPGDRANYTPDGMLQLHGRDSVTINSGGEKIFAEEVEKALAHHPAVYDAVVTGRPSDRWGNEVVAVVQLRDGFEPDVASLLSECEKHIARYKLPKDFVFVDQVVRSPAGKADYRWARETASQPS